MSRLTLLPAAARTVQSWKNGGGKTTEIAVSPAGADIDGFDWRISTATVSTAGGFSCFDGIDRTLAVIAGRLRLEFDASTTELDAATPPYPFPGDVACFGTPLDQEVTDLNLMTGRGRFAGAIERVEAPIMASISIASAHAVVIFVEGGSFRLRSERFVLQPWDAIRIDEGVGELIAVESDGAVYVVSITPLQA